MAMTPNIVKQVLELYSQDIAKVTKLTNSDILATSVFKLRDYELATLLQIMYNKGMTDTLDSLESDVEDIGRSQYD
jgi:hypothetical protein